MPSPFFLHFGQGSRAHDRKSAGSRACPFPRSSLAVMRARWCWVPQVRLTHFVKDMGASRDNSRVVLFALRFARAGFAAFRSLREKALAHCSTHRARASAKRFGTPNSAQLQNTPHYAKATPQALLFFWSGFCFVRKHFFFILFFFFLGVEFGTRYFCSYAIAEFRFYANYIDLLTCNC